jgi:rhodanese-related sulfurtransferase
MLGKITRRSLRLARRGGDTDRNMAGQGHIDRRMLVAGICAAGAATGGGYYAWTWRRPFRGSSLSVAEAHARAASGEILLVDIRRPDEWAETGLGEGAYPLDMRRPDFAVAFARLREAAPGRPVALICVRGVRSSQLLARLAAADVGPLIDVPEGMLGSGAGQGWLAAGLPVARLADDCTQQ